MCNLNTKRVCFSQSISQVEVGAIGEKVDLSYRAEWLGNDIAALEKFISGKTEG